MFPRIVPENVQTYYENLNEAQKHAVRLCPQNHAIVSAGAGTGKTRVLTLRYAFLVKEQGIEPEKIMAVTFTNKAAYEMRKRLATFFPIHNLWIGTFHALGMRILRDHHIYIHRSASYRILDMRDQLSLVQKILKNNTASSTAMYTPKMVLEKISAWKQADLLPHEISSRTPFYHAMYEEYERHMRVMDALDFDDLLLWSARVIRDYPHIRETLSFSHILVDEYQDINHIQHTWLMLFTPQAHLFCVGDEDQSIYGWRGAHVDRMIQFMQQFPSAQHVSLEENYRSTSHILSCANAIIARNTHRKPKSLFTRQTGGEKIHIQGLWDHTEEAAFVAQHVMRAYDDDPFSLKDMAILVRTSAQTRTFEERFLLQSIPYHLMGGTRFYDRLEIRDFLSYLRVIQSENDNLAFERILNVPKRGLGPIFLKNLYDIASRENISLEQAARCIPSDEVQNTLSLLLQKITNWRVYATTMQPSELTEHVLQDSGYEAFWESQGPQGQIRQENLRELIKATEPFETLDAFLEHVSLLGDQHTENESGIAIMTLHAAKGLEFDTVFLAGWEEYVFPHVRALEEKGKEGLAEERRLAYVGITRAKKKAIITFCWNRKHHQGMIACTPSRFIQDLPQEHTVITMKLSYQAKAPSAEAQKVVHVTFGRGVVQAETGHIVSVLFEKHGLKKVVKRFLEFLSQ